VFLPVQLSPKTPVNKGSQAVLISRTVVYFLSIFLKIYPKIGKILSLSPLPVGYGDFQQP
jgi:hypothetical protein